MYAQRARRRELAILSVKGEEERLKLPRDIGAVMRVDMAVSVPEPTAAHLPDLSRMLDLSRAHLPSSVGRLSTGALQARLIDERLFPASQGIGRSLRSVVSALGLR